ncbi:quinol:cytochrome c oxidoreductase monoheme cytochrome subunit [Lutibacter sp. Hel_I_33_5]|uniref:c-type cytochrome n=1 Tax=Lutibacter sp. Hel_I_33_5 TaxID=1566289 RepID=UPI0011ADA994|nr:cytochrome c [Lutibacter sp. Hel_I_33_5]TVZ56110.1 quinol:cytochrome c oxidoreductase monoheme cytochrome subunit [Lutibacter sp. Hel_I_33_5]
MKHFKLLIALVVVSSIISCNDKRTPQVQYMPDMYVSVPYDVNGVDGLNGKAVNLKPVAGTIPRGGQPAYDIADTNEGYEKAKAELTNPLEVTEESLANGKKNYDIYCAICHGKKGDGEGTLTTREKFAGIPNYKDRDINAGSIYHVIMYGKNLMGSHSSQLNTNERWEVVQYVEKLRTELTK